jgi:hypothetical protein
MRKNQSGKHKDPPTGSIKNPVSGSPCPRTLASLALSQNSRDWIWLHKKKSPHGSEGRYQDISGVELKNVMKFIMLGWWARQGSNL